MEYVAQGTLYDQHRRQPLNAHEAIKVLGQTLAALDHIHEQNMIHRDVKLDNLLVASRSPLRVKLSDFGLTTEESMAKGYCGTLPYCAPEMCSDKPYYMSADVWSLGVTILMLLWTPRMEKIRKSFSGADICNNIVQMGTELSQQGANDAKKQGLPIQFKFEVHNFVMKRMVQIEPNSRLSAKLCWESGKESLFWADQQCADGPPSISTNEMEDLWNPVGELGPTASRKIPEDQNIGSEDTTHVPGGRESLPGRALKDATVPLPLHSEAPLLQPDLQPHPVASDHAPPSLPEQRQAKRMRLGTQVDEVEPQNVAQEPQPHDDADTNRRSADSLSSQLTSITQMAVPPAEPAAPAAVMTAPKSAPQAAAMPASKPKRKQGNKGAAVAGEPAIEQRVTRSRAKAMGDALQKGI